MVCGGKTSTARLGAGLIAVLLAACAGVKASAEPLTDGSPRREAMAAAQNAIPYDRLTEETQMRIWSVVGNASIYRRLPPQRIECDPDLFVFLVRRPEVIVNIWQVMGISQVSAQRTGAYTLQASDGAGTQSLVDLVYGSRDTHLIYADGYYEGPLLKRRTTGKCVLLLQSSYGQTPDGRPLVDLTLDVFLKIESAGAELLARTLYPLVGNSADMNFVETAKFIGKLSEAAETNSAGVQRLALRLEQLDGETRQKFMQLTATVAQRADARLAAPERLEVEHLGEAPRPLSSAGAATSSRRPAALQEAPEEEAALAVLGAEISPKRSLLLRR